MSEKLIEFRAGIAAYDEDTQMCTPLPVQGRVKIQPTEEEGEEEEGVGGQADDESVGFWQFNWTPSTEKYNSSSSSGSSGSSNGTASEKYEPISLILIPGETAWVHVKSAKGGRVFALVFSSNQKYFFWMQEKNKRPLGPDDLSDKDKQIYERLQKILSAPIFDNDEMDVDDRLDTNMAQPPAEGRA